SPLLASTLMARILSAALALVVAVTGTALPAAAAPPLPAAQTATPTTLASPDREGGGARVWSLPLDGVPRSAVMAAPAFTRAEHDGEAPAGRLAALSPQSRTERFTI